jgi:hypothetical protein
MAFFEQMTNYPYYYMRKVKTIIYVQQNKYNKQKERP